MAGSKKPVEKKAEVNFEQAVLKEEQHGLSGAARKMLLFSYGAVATAIEEAYALIHHLSEQREAAEKEGRKIFDEMMEKRKEDRQRIEAALRKRLPQESDQPALPSKVDIRTLDEQVAELSRQVEEMAKA